MANKDTHDLKNNELQAKITELMKENKELRLQLEVKNNYNTSKHRNTTKSGKMQQTQILRSDPTLKKLPNNKEIKFWTSESGEKLLIVQNPKYSNAYEEFDCAPSLLVKIVLCIFLLIHMGEIYPMLLIVFLDCCCFHWGSGVDTLQFWFSSMITVGTQIVIIFSLLLSYSNVVDKTICIICIICGIILDILGIYVIYCHAKWLNKNKNILRPKRTIKIDYAKNEIIVKHTWICYGFFSRNIKTKDKCVIPISYDDKYFFGIQTDEHDNGSNGCTYFHSLYAGHYPDKHQVFQLSKDGTSKQAAQTYGNTLIKMINDKSSYE